jgi:hypothetical protein
MTGKFQDRWCASLAAMWGPHQLPQKRSLTLASILQSLGAAEIANMESRDFEFFNTIGAKRSFANARLSAERALLCDADVNGCRLHDLSSRIVRYGPSTLDFFHGYPHAG